MTEPADALDHVFQTGDDDAAALEVFGGARFTRTQLQDEVLRCAAWLAAEGVGSGTRVICDAGRSAEHVIALLGCWWLGAVFVPLERDLLELRRQAFMARLDHAFDPRLWSRTDWATHAPIDRPRVTLQPESPAYIAFTSGSTGTPKGAVIPHGGLAPLASTQVAAFRVAPGHRTSWGLAAHFDASFSDILVPLFAGATLVVLPEDGPSLLTALEAAALTHVDLPPSLLAAAVARGLPSGLETIVCGGEPAPRAALRAAARDVHMVNVYGPTETTVCASVEVVAADGSDSTYDSIGTPLPGVVFDVDESGELLIGGWGVALGYLEDTADGAFTGEGEARRYRTGDLVQALPDGSFAFLGRIDRQVQIRGKRIEPEEDRTRARPAPGRRRSCRAGARWARASPRCRGRHPRGRCRSPRVAARTTGTLEGPAPDRDRGGSSEIGQPEGRPRGHVGALHRRPRSNADRPRPAHARVGRRVRRRETRRRRELCEPRR